MAAGPLRSALYRPVEACPLYTSLLKYGHLFETKLMDLSVNIPLEEALDLGWEILAECFEPNETGLKTSLIQERWPKRSAVE